MVHDGGWSKKSKTLSSVNMIYERPHISDYADGIRIGYLSDFFWNVGGARRAHLQISEWDGFSYVPGIKYTDFQQKFQWGTSVKFLKFEYDFRK